MAGGWQGRPVAVRSLVCRADLLQQLPAGPVVLSMSGSMGMDPTEDGQVFEGMAFDSSGSSYTREIFLMHLHHGFGSAKALTFQHQQIQSAGQFGGVPALRMPARCLLSFVKTGHLTSQHIVKRHTNQA